MSSKKMIALAVAFALSATLTACSGNSTSSEGSPVSITVWAWEPTVKKAVPGFEKENPDIKVKVTNAGSSAKEYQALSNALSAGKGAPDLVQLDFNAIPQFALSEGLADLSQFGADKIMDRFTTGARGGVTVNEKVYGMPIGGGPMALFYNKSIFDKAGITEVPKTWDEYYDAAKKIRTLGPDYYITAETGTDAGVALSLIWQGGGALSVVIESKQAKAAYEFAKYIGAGKGSKTLVDNGIVPDITEQLESKQYTEKTDSYFGGQKVNKMLAQPPPM